MPIRRAARVCLFGAPGVGKGTQTERMLRKYPQLSSISSGDLLRENVRLRTPLGIQAERIMSTGGLVPDTVILRLIRNALTTRGWLVPTEEPRPFTLNSAAVGFDTVAADLFTMPPTDDTEHTYSEAPEASFILDGFPRTVCQAKKLAEMLPINMVFHIHTPPDIIIDRICNRWIHAPSGRVYNTTFNAPQVPGRDDITGEPLTQRDDDRPEVWKARLHSFEENVTPLLEYYDRLGVLWKVQGNCSDDITPKIFDEFSKRFCD
ncbi:adenylate kinase [Piedraia hortae CBS 480.64]|uniref:GTP:AMP phosphotransferase, mitochondrial n=1 Tax=Piedraia hortae CBS 480.64 TaxID=1314780 RepID=A0A6A7BSZ7_9PEZI|nr:adenylate kinase [Piedraia hortae CBS 480.64]